MPLQVTSSHADSSASSGLIAGAELELACRVLRAESRAVASLAERLETSPLAEEFARAVDLIVTCADQGGTVLVTGLGKSGLVGAKISATLASLGIPSHHVHPTEAAHGDLGRFRPVDCCLALSYSGETDEVVAVASTLRQDGLPIITITKGRDGGTLSRRGLPPPPRRSGSSYSPLFAGACRHRLAHHRARR